MPVSHDNSRAVPTRRANFSSHVSRSAPFVTEYKVVFPVSLFRASVFCGNYLGTEHLALRNKLKCAGVDYKYLLQRVPSCSTWFYQYSATATAAAAAATAAAAAAAATAGAREERAGTCGIKLQKAVVIYFNIFRPVYDTVGSTSCSGMCCYCHCTVVPPELAEQKHVSHLYFNGSFYTRE